MPALAAQGRHHALIIPIGRKGAPRTTAEPLTTLATRPHHSLVIPALTVDDCTLRMLSVAELKQVQRFPADYIILGNQTEAILQIGKRLQAPADGLVPTATVGRRSPPCTEVPQAHYGSVTIRALRVRQ